MNLIDECLEMFDADKVADTMSFLDWKWATLGRPPTAKEIRKKARYLAEQAYSESKNWQCLATIGSGGIEASYDPKYRHFMIRFVLTWGEAERFTPCTECGEPAEGPHCITCLSE